MRNTNQPNEGCQRGVDGSPGCGHGEGIGYFGVCMARDCFHKCSLDTSVRVPDERHEFLEQPRGKFPKPENADGKCWEVVNMVYCGQPRDAACHAVEPPKCAGLEGCQALEGVMYDLFVHDPECPKGRNTAVSSTQPDAARDDIENIVAVVRDEFQRQAEFGCTPSAEDYRISIWMWLERGIMPSDDEQ